MLRKLLVNLPPGQTPHQASEKPPEGMRGLTKPASMLSKCEFCQGAHALEAGLPPEA